MAVAVREDALVGMDVTGVIVEAELYTPGVQRAHELSGMRKERAPVVATLPAVVVPGEIQHERVERNVTAPHPRHFIREVLLVVAPELWGRGCGRAWKVFEVEIRNPRSQDEAR